MAAAAGRAFSQARLPGGVGPTLRCVSYNILADKWAGSNSYCPPEWLDWSYRCRRLLEELEAYSPDLLCLQEVQTDVYEAVLEPWMQQHGYGSVFNPRQQAAGSTTSGPLDGVSLHFRHDCFKLIRSHSARFADHAKQLLPACCCSRHANSRRGRRGAGSPGSSGRAARSAFMKALQAREEGAVMALLEHQPSQQQLLACSTHLHWNPAVPDVKLAQAALLCHCIVSFLEQQGQPPSDTPLVVGGDFNSMPLKFASDAWDTLAAGQTLTSGVYALLSEGAVTPDHPDHPVNRQFCRDCRRSNSSGSSSNGSSRRGSPSGSRSPSPGQQQQQHLDGFTFNTCGLQLHSSHFAAHNREPTLTTRTSSFSGCLDYVWLSTPHWQVAGTLQMPYEEPLGEPGPPEGVTTLGTCPNKQQPSDHLAVGCDAVLLPPREPAARTLAAADVDDAAS